EGPNAGTWDPQNVMIWCKAAQETSLSHSLLISTSATWIQTEDFNPGHPPKKADK
ncbi:hypothetical protein M9458_009820, partial [Cirrhinus mrigala]